jgi:hypothetical protein
MPDQEARMVTIHLDPSRLSLEELANVSRVLRERCSHCIERGVPDGCRHTAEVDRFLDVLAAAIDAVREPLEHEQQVQALAVDPSSGEWVAGA